ncbi:AaceriAEL167Cp [[Ashbya] aceris (nom. inval.)]|nr:AaceriAEL167Cp [[Ashbya] aceris (nom. inval.)]
MLSLRSSFRRLFSVSCRAYNQQPQKAVSSCPAGTPLNLLLKKGGKEPLALEDSEYPEWLWTVLDSEAQAAKLAEDPIKARKKALRRMNREHIKQQNFLAKM